VQYSLWYIVPNTLPVGDLVTGELRYQITAYLKLFEVLPRELILNLTTFALCVIYHTYIPTVLEFYFRRGELLDWADTETAWTERQSARPGYVC